MLLIYGATGYTGTLIAEEARRRGLREVILAGRSEAKLRPLAARLGFGHRAFELARPDLAGVRAVLHCAGPFSATSRPMVDACLAARAHYLDITGEVDVFEAIFARDAEARARGVALLPGAGFDVVPSDCLASHLAEKLPGATALELAFASGGAPGPGTLKTMIEGLAQGGRVRRGGRLIAVPPASEVREIDFGDRRRTAMSIPWGDLSTAWRSTGIPDITVFIAASPSAIRAARLTRHAAPLLGLSGVQAFLKARVERNVQGPREDQRARGWMRLWGRVTRGTAAASATLQTPEGYTFTASAALACAARIAEVQPGAWTPSQAFGHGFAATLPGVTLQDLP